MTTLLELECFFIFLTMEYVLDILLELLQAVNESASTKRSPGKKNSVPLYKAYQATAKQEHRPYSC